MQVKEKISALERCSERMLVMLEERQHGHDQYLRIIDSIVALEKEIRTQKNVSKYASKES